MCGITGFLDNSNQSSAHLLHASIKCMSDTLAHRGPDDSGVWVDEKTGLAFGHRRLAIIDLSKEGHQPMPSQCGRYLTTFNGEIYNFQELRHDLTKKGHTFRGHSDTEVMLTAMTEWGIIPTLERLVGMFAVAVWDRQERTLFLGRDRLGEKPLYYGWVGSTFLFGSEIKALQAHPKWEGTINRDALTLYMRHNYIPTPYSIFENIHKLPPGTWLALPATTVTPGILPLPQPYWSMRHIVKQGKVDPFTGNDDEAISQLDHLLRQAIAGQMVADVPLGAFLSGGVDSSTIVALMQAQSKHPVRTFTIGFHEKGFNEAQYAKAVANHLGTDHTELYVTSDQAKAVIPRLPLLYSEPFADSSQIPTFLVSELTRQHVTVSLSGDGGDELFGGYTRYQITENFWNKTGWVPPSIRKAMGHSLLSFLSDSVPLNGSSKKGRALPGNYLQTAKTKLKVIAEVLLAENPELLYRRNVSHMQQPTDLVLEASEPMTVLTNQAQWIVDPHLTHKLMYFDTLSYLPDDILVKVDRASMGVSLESRIPLLDHRLVEFAWRLPFAMKVRNGQSKWLLRQVLYKYVPKELIERPKTGFGVPLNAWLRTDLRDWAEALLDEQRLREEGFFKPEPIRQKWLDHVSGSRDWHSYLWNILMFQAWLEHQGR